MDTHNYLQYWMDSETRRTYLMKPKEAEKKGFDALRKSEEGRILSERLEGLERLAWVVGFIEGMKSQGVKVE